MPTTTDVDELHQLIDGLRRCVTSLDSTHGDTPAMRRIVNDAECIRNGIDRLEIDVEELELTRGLSQPTGSQRDDPDPRHRVPRRFLAGRRPRRHWRPERSCARISRTRRRGSEVPPGQRGEMRGRHRCPGC